MRPDLSSERLQDHDTPSPRPYSPHHSYDSLTSPQASHSTPIGSPLRHTISPSTSQTSPSSLDRSLDRSRDHQEPLNNNNKSSSSSPVKPKIWSLADVATSNSSTSPSRSSTAPTAPSLPAHVYSVGHAHPGFPAIYGALRPWFNGAAFPAGVTYPLTAHPNYLMSAASVAKGFSPSGPGIPAHYTMMAHGIPGYRVDAVALSRAAAAGVTTISPSPVESEVQNKQKTLYGSPTLSARAIGE